MATATAEDADLLRGLGAAEVIGYRDAYPRVATAVNLVLPDLDGIAAAVEPGGRLLTITHPLPEARADVDVEFVLDLDGALGGMREVAELAADGTLPATISRRYCRDEAGRACVDFVREHTTGKLVVTT